MSNLQSGADKAQMIELLNSIKIPIMGAGGGFAPIGTRGYFEGQTAPQGWLICDGSTKNIADYPDLATYIASQHGSVNYYGGDGTTTFGLPTMNGMPTNVDNILSESEIIVGIDKDRKPIYQKCYYVGNNTGTIEIPMDVNDFGRIIYMYGASDMEDTYHEGYTIPKASPSYSQELRYVVSSSERKIKVMCQNSGDGWEKALIVVRYTKANDSAIPLGHSSDGNGVFCVKATLSDANLDAYTVYSPNEHQVGWWQEEISGVLKQKPLYSKTFSFVSGGASWITVDPNGDHSDWEISFTENIFILGADGSFFGGNNNYGILVNTPNSEVNQFVVNCPANTNGKTGYITVCYTKTTDEWQVV